MPHLLIARSDRFWKVGCITSIAACLAMNNAPEDLRLVMIDSKMFEFAALHMLAAFCTARWKPTLSASWV